MATLPATQVRVLLDRAAASASDSELLERFRRRRDLEALEILIRRHGPLVLAACRKVLAHDADVEDAFQASFVILIKKAAAIRQAESIGSWLYGVAHRIAVRMRQCAARRRAVEAVARLPVAVEPPEMSWNEACAAIHQEIDRLPERLRRPLLLCCLEGRSRSQTAKDLGCSLQVVKGRLERGRNLLRRRLIRRGLALSAGMLPMPASIALGSALPRTLIDSTIQSLTGRPSAAVVRLAAQATASGFPSRLAAGLVVLVALGMGFSLAHELRSSPQTQSEPPPLNAALSNAPPEARLQPVKTDSSPLKSERTITVRGRVLDPGGKPVAGAKLMMADPKTDAAIEKAKTDSTGRFQLEVENNESVPGVLAATAKGFGGDWVVIRGSGEVTLRLMPQLVIEGRVLDLEGKPHAKLEFRVEEIATTAAGDLDPVLKLWPVSPAVALRAADKRLRLPQLLGLPQSLRTDAEGRLRLTNLGRGRILTLRPVGQGVVHNPISVVGTEEFDSRVRQAPIRMRGPAPIVFGPRFEYVPTPSRVVIGIVRDKATKKPVAGAKIAGNILDMGRAEDATAVTDGQGKFRLDGLPKAKEIELTVAADGQPYLPTWKSVVDQPGFAPIAVEIELEKGVEVTGKCVDVTTGKSIPGTFMYFPLRANQNYRPANFRDVSAYLDEHKTLPDGSFRVTIMPGPGIILARASNPVFDKFGVNHYTQVQLAEKDKIYAGRRQPGDPADRIAGAGVAKVPLLGRNAYQIIDPTQDSGPFHVVLNLHRGRHVSGDVMDADGKPLAGAEVCGLTEIFPAAVRLAGSEFTAEALDPHTPRTIVFRHSERKLFGKMTLRGDEKERAKVKLEPCASAKGRLLDSDGRPRKSTPVLLMYEDLPVYAYFAFLGSAFPFPMAITDAEGEFNFDNIFPTVEFSVVCPKGGANLGAGDRFPKVKLKPGEACDLGTLKGRPND